MGIARTTNKFGAVINPLRVRKVQILTIGRWRLFGKRFFYIRNHFIRNLHVEGLIFKEPMLLKEKSLRNFSFSKSECCTQIQVKITLHWMISME